MSNLIINLIPVRIGLIPEIPSIDMIKKTLHDIDISCENISFSIKNSIEVIGSKKNLQSVKCNKCYADAVEWWADYMITSEENEYKVRSFITPCCGNESSLEELLYDSDVGFARFVLILKDPSNLLSKTDIEQLSELFKTDMRSVIED